MTSIERFVIDTATVRPAALTIAALWPSDVVSAQGHSLASPYRRMNVLNGCEGLDVLFLLVAAILSAEMGWRRRIAAALIGFVFVFCVNQIRIVALWKSAEHWPDYFGLLHGTLFPIGLVAMTGLFFLACLTYRRHTDAVAE